MDQINVGIDPTAEELAAQEAHNAAMAALVDGQTPPEVPPEEPPKLFAGKYKTVEEMEAGYKELESKIGKPPAPPTDPPEVVPPATEADAAKLAAEKGFDYEALTQEYLANESKLTPETMKRLADAGIPEAMVNAHIELLETKATAVRQTAYDIVGGKDTYSTMIDWASNNLSAPEIEAFNAATKSSVEQTMLAVRGLYAQYVSSEGEPNANFVAGKPAGKSSDVYESTAQLVADMNDKRYDKDPAFRKQVELKLGRSKIL